MYVSDKLQICDFVGHCTLLCEGYQLGCIGIIGKLKFCFAQAYEQPDCTGIIGISSMVTQTLLVSSPVVRALLVSSLVA